MEPPGEQEVNLIASVCLQSHVARADCYREPYHAFRPRPIRDFTQGEARQARVSPHHFVHPEVTYFGLFHPLPLWEKAQPGTKAADAFCSEFPTEGVNRCE